MYRRTLLIGLVASLAACGSREFESPRNLDNACALGRERPNYLRAMRRAERNWNVPVHVQMAVIHQESRFDGDIRPPFRYALGVIPMGRQSSAIGYSQALDGTWDEYVADTGNRGADRTDIRDATDFMGWYMNLTVERNNIPLTDARRQYLAYHEGHSGYARGSYNAKPWLIEVAQRVEARAERYRQQLERC
ncbi:lytic transglycosylase [Rhodobacteraceae bacterium N5(2021)]|uniref:Lytic transglycosylase n=1 Tax=Gymnodinialimonas phycosphaerae TaxID=2841589 RepID=A0A975TTI6_9RHOB|nr:lytic transglycosylase [Gymnodinialimonas phycosphaerae]MBY4894498.1 lytic transglycosylase [Gymnodinialimonas phycosphaerae]